MRVPLAILTFLLASGLAAGADDAATQAKEKQSAQAKQAKQPRKGPVKVYSDEDLKKARENPSANVTVLGSPDAPPPAVDAPAGSGVSNELGTGRGDELGTGGGDELGTGSAEMDRRFDEAAWRSMAREAWGSVRAAEARIRELEARIQDLLLGDRDPNPPDLLDPTRLQKREAARAEAQAQLEGARGELAAAQQGVENLQERARAAAVPQLWVEEPQPEPEQKH